MKVYFRSVRFRLLSFSFFFIARRWFHMVSGERWSPYAEFASGISFHQFLQGFIWAYGVFETCISVFECRWYSNEGECSHVLYEPFSLKKQKLSDLISCLWNSMPQFDFIKYQNMKITSVHVIQNQTKSLEKNEVFFPLIQETWRHGDRIICNTSENYYDNLNPWPSSRQNKNRGKFSDKLISHNINFGGSG